MKINRLLLLTGICASLLCPFSVFSQVTYNKQGGTAIGVKPESSKLLNGAGLDNMDYATGTLRLGITLYEIKVNDISVPITLNYSATGLKANQKAGPVGMGWELSAGGKITTIVNGIPDNDVKGLSTNYNSSPLSGLSEPGYFNVESSIPQRTFAIGSMNNAVDGAWDAYSYNIPNGGGKFMNARGNFLTFPYDPLLKFTEKGLTKGDGLFYSFSDGDIKSVFKRTFRTKGSVPQFTLDGFKEYEPYVATKNLTKISSSRFKDEVIFDYEAFTEAYRPYSETINTLAIPLTRSVSWNPVNGGAWVASNVYYVREPSISQTFVSFVKSTRLKNINFPNGRVVFEYDEDYLGQDVLKAISIQQKNASSYKALKKFNFLYSKSYSHYLTGIYVTDENENDIYKWEFDYYGQLPVNMGFTDTETNAQDRWGFYNGKTNNQSLIENPMQILSLQTKEHYGIYRVGGSSAAASFPITSAEAHVVYPNNMVGYANFADREFVFSEAIKGTLKSVRIPTGGYVDYEYEPHKFMLNRSSGSPVVTTGGGIRIKSITTSDAEHQMQLKKEYKYGLNGTGEYDDINVLESGYGMVAFPANISTSNAIYSSSGNPISLTVQNLSILSHAVNDMNYSSGSYGIYRNVSEYTLKSTIGTAAVEKYSGRTLYFFNVPQQDNLQGNYGSTLSTLNILPPINTGADPDNLYGKPYKIIQQRINASGFDPVKRTSYSYQRYKAPEQALPQDSYSYYGRLNGVRSDHYANSSFQFKHQTFTNGEWVEVHEIISADGSTAVDPLFFANIEYETPENYYTGKYGGGVYDMNSFSDSYRSISEQTENFGDTNPYQTSIFTTNFTYNDKLQPTEVKVNDTNGRVKRQRTKFASDFAAISNMGIGDLKTSSMLTDPVQQLATIEIDGTEKVIGGVFNEYLAHDGLVSVEKVNQLNTSGKPFAYSLLSSAKDSRYELRKTMEYDANGNLLQFAETAAPKTAIIYGYNNQYAIAQAVNTEITDIAYTGFEQEETGNWTYNVSYRSTVASPNGKYAFQLSGGSISKVGLTAAKAYILSYWLKDDAVANVAGGTVSAAVVKRSLPGWKLIERRVTGTTSLSVSGTGYIDELRLYPQGAQMTSYTYDPLIGLSSSTDPDGKTIYYEYDSFQRLRQIKDQQGEVVKRVEYNYVR